MLMAAVQRRKRRREGQIEKRKIYHACKYINHAYKYINYTEHFKLEPSGSAGQSTTMESVIFVQ